MNNKDESNKKMVELLWIEINRAILSSDNVKSTLLNLRKLGMLGAINEYNLVVDVNKMVEMMLEKHEHTEKLLKPQQNAEPADDYREPEPLHDETLFEDNPFISESAMEPIVKEKATFRKPRQYIDGKPLSNNQVFFQEYQANKFDDDGWMKKLRVRF